MTAVQGCSVLEITPPAARVSVWRGRVPVWRILSVRRDSYVGKITVTGGTAALVRTYCTLSRQNFQYVIRVLSLSMTASLAHPIPSTCTFDDSVTITFHEHSTLHKKDT